MNEFFVRLGTVGFGVQGVCIQGLGTRVEGLGVREGFGGVESFVSLRGCAVCASGISQGEGLRFRSRTWVLGLVLGG